MEQYNEPAQQDAAVAAIGALAHKMHGQALSFGFAKIGNLAAELEAFLDLVLVKNQPMDVEKFSDLLNDLLDEIEQEVAAV